MTISHLHSMLALTTTCSDMNMHALLFNLSKLLFFWHFQQANAFMQFVSQNVSTLLTNAYNFLDKSS